MKRLGPLLFFPAFPLVIGLLSSFLTRNITETYSILNKPALSPPAIVFPIVWTILYVLMGLSAYLVYKTCPHEREHSLYVWALQLIFNFFWSFLFFNGQAYLISFIWLIILWALIIVMIVGFYRCRPIAGLLQIPYLLWVTFAGYLNFMVYQLNK